MKPQPRSSGLKIPEGCNFGRLRKPPRCQIVDTCLVHEKPRPVEIEDRHINKECTNG